MEKNEDIEIESSKDDTFEIYEEIKETEAEERTVEELIQSLEDTKKLADEYLDRLQRLQAEFDNYKKRLDREKAEFIEYANANLISELIDVMENLERGINSAKESDDKASIVRGMELVYTTFKDILESKGLKPIEAEGLKFDPYYHEAMMKTPTDEYPNNTVIEEFQRGYRIKDRIVRYSKVRVSVDENKKNNTSS